MCNSRSITSSRSVIGHLALSLSVHACKEMSRKNKELMVAGTAWGRLSWSSIRHPLDLHQMRDGLEFRVTGYKDGRLVDGTCHGKAVGIRHRVLKR